MSFSVIIAPRARSQSLGFDAWWQVNRLAAPDLFSDELEAVIDRLETNPNIGMTICAGRRPLRFMVMQRTGYRVFYRVDERKALLRVLIIWSALRGNQPRF